MDNNSKHIGLYIHIPFCLHKCAYCDFCSAEQKDKMQKAAYVDALVLDIENTAKQVSDDGIIVDSIYFGGGTPTLLTKKEIYLLTDTIYDCFNVTEDAEFTFEANPATLDTSKAKCLIDCGVNRLSIGLQSVHNEELEALERIHDYRDFVKSYKAARKAGFDNINVDVMYGIPEQSEASFSETLEAVCDAEPEHISMYGLRIEDSTPFAAYRHTLNLPSEESEYAMYRIGREYLAQRGYTQYEISNYAKNGKESRHNLKYWQMKEYLGFGVSAHSYYGNKRYARISDTDKYISCICGESDFETIIAKNSVEVIDEKAREIEYVMLSLRMASGVNKEEYEKLFGVSFDSKYKSRIKDYVDAGFLINSPKSCTFSVEGLYVSNRILSDILDL